MRMTNATIHDTYKVQRHDDEVIVATHKMRSSI